MIFNDLFGLNCDDDSSGDEVGQCKRSPPSKVSTLEHIALECVNKNFGIFVETYSASEDPVVRNNLEFLRFLYSSKIIYTKLENGVLDPKYFDFLLNEHLTELNFAIFAVEDFDAVLKRIKDVGHGIHKATFDRMLLYARYSFKGEEVKEFISNIVCCLPKVNILNIGCFGTDEILKNISTHCLDLKKLYLDGSKSVTCSGFEFLCSNAGHTCALNTLSLEFIKESNIPISFLIKNMPSLEVLRFRNLWKNIYAIHKNDFENNCLSISSWKYKFTTLTLDQADVPKYTDVTNNVSQQNLTKNGRCFEDMVFICSEICPNVKTLTLIFKEEFDIMLVSKFLKLENLTLLSRGAPLNLNDFLLKSGGNLKSLAINDRDSLISLQASVLVQSCPKLEYLKIKGVSFQAMSNAVVKPLTSLKQILFKDLHSHPFSVDYILKCSSNLEHLTFKRCTIWDLEMNTNLAMFFKNSALQYIKFSLTGVSEALLQTIILTCTAIKTITVNFCDNISDVKLDNLEKIAENMPNFINMRWKTVGVD